jgi:hypothetical protein
MWKSRLLKHARGGTNVNTFCAEVVVPVTYLIRTFDPSGHVSSALTAHKGDVITGSGFKLLHVGSLRRTGVLVEGMEGGRSGRTGERQSGFDSSV